MYPETNRAKLRATGLARRGGALHWSNVNAASASVERVRRTIRRFATILCAAAATGCAAKAPPVVSSPEAAAPAPPRAAAPAPVYDVPAMSTFSVALLNPVGTRLSAPGDSFRAKVISPLTTLRGYTLVPVGSVLK